MHTVFQPLLWVLATAALGVVSGMGPAPTRSRHLPAAYHIVGVRLAEPRRDWCGPAALAAVLQHYGAEVTAAEIARDIYLPDYRGTLNLDLLLWARKRGFEAWAGKGSLEMMKDAVARDHPVICMVRRRGPLADRNHFVVVWGYDDSRQVWFVDRGDNREETVKTTDFEPDWRECECWMLVVEGKERLSRSAGSNESS